METIYNYFLKDKESSLLQIKLEKALIVVSIATISLAFITIAEEKLSVEQINMAIVKVNSGTQNTTSVYENIALNVVILKVHAKKLKNLLAKS